MREHYRAQAPLETSDDPLDRRLAEEIETVARQLELVEAELARRSAPGTARLAERLEAAEGTLNDLAGIVGADDRCEGVGRAAPELKRRLNRRAPDGSASPCENR